MHDIDDAGQDEEGRTVREQYRDQQNACTCHKGTFQDRQSCPIHGAQPAIPAGRWTSDADWKEQ